MIAPVASDARAVPPSRTAVERIARYQDETVTRAQLLEIGAFHSWIDRRVLLGEWQRLFPGVFVVHNGPVAWESRARGALLYAGRNAALSRTSAAFVHEMVPAPPRVLDVDVPAGRRVQRQRLLRVHLRRQMPVAYGHLLTVSPAETVLDLVADSRSVDDALSIVAAALRVRTSSAEILDAAARRRRLRRRPLLLELLGEVDDGIESPLELRYRRDVERRHHLPHARLQVRQRLGGSWIRADAVYEGLGVRVELDGRLGHPGGRTDADTWRDNMVLIEHGDVTLRYRWSHVAVAPCTTAAQVAAALHARGWAGRARACRAGCRADDAPPPRT